MSFRQHFAHHRWHMFGCVFAATLVVAVIVFGAPVLAVLGGLFCAAMMIGMVWMMATMGANHLR